MEHEEVTAMPRWGRYGGEMLMATGALHTVVGLWLFREPLNAIRRDGFIDTVLPHEDRELAFWFMIGGAGLLMTGQLASWTQRRTGTLPPALGWSLLGTSAVGAALMPRSGFWLMIPQALLILRRSNREARCPEAA